MLQCVRGFKDHHDTDQIKSWQNLEQFLTKLAERYGYHEVRLPMLEDSSLYSRSVGQTSDIVHKEMYTFIDKDNSSISLRPEGTAGVVRMVLEHSLSRDGRKKYYYNAPMFRRERPQKGRFRQFHQFGVEVIAEDEPFADIENIIMLNEIFQTLKITTAKLKINYLGDAQCRNAHKKALQEYYRPFINQFSQIELERFHNNPLRLLDSKSEAMMAINAKAPELALFYDAKAEEQFSFIADHLKSLSIDFEVDPRLVRGLDYYSGLIYEWVSDDLGSQSAICGGGRYDGLSLTLGGKDAIPCCGFSIGLERLLSLLDHSQFDIKKYVDVTWIDMVGVDTHKALSQLTELRAACPDICFNAFHQKSKLKSVLKQANKTASDFVIIFGVDEEQSAQLTLKNMQNGHTESLSMHDLIIYLNAFTEEEI